MKRFNLLAIVFFLLVALSCVVNLFSLYSQSIRLDESQSVWVATKSIPTILQFTAEDVHVPLYLLFLHLWMQIFGIGIFNVRILSFIFFVLTLPVLYTFVKEASNKKVAYVTVLLFSLSPFVIWFSHEARMYTLFLLVTSVNHLFFLRMVRSEGSKGKFGYLLSTVAGMFTHYFFSFLLLTQFIYLLVTLIRKVAVDPKRTKMSFWKLFNQSSRLLRRQVILLIGAGIMFAPWVVFVLSRGSASNTQPLIPRPTSFNIFQTFVQYIFGFQSQGLQAFIIALWPITLLMLFFVFTKRKKIDASNLDYFAVVSILPIVLVFAISFIRPIFLSRYLIFITPSLFFLLSWVLMSYSRKVSMFLVSAFLLLMSILSLYQNTSAATPVREDYVGVSTYLSKQVSAKDVIAVSAPFTVYPIEYSYRGSAQIVTIPEWNRFVEGSIPAFSIENLDTQIKNMKKQHINLYVVLSYDQGYEQKIREYLDNNYEMRESKKFPPGIEVRKYVLRYDVQ